MKSESAFQFINPELESIEFCINDEFDKESVDINTSLSVMIENNDCDDIDCDTFAKVYLQAIIGDKTDDVPFYINVVISSVFRWKENVEDIKSLLKINAPTLLLSYLRPIISNITGWSKFPAYNMPFVNMAEELDNDM